MAAMLGWRLGGTVEVPDILIYGPYMFLGYVKVRRKNVVLICLKKHLDDRIGNKKPQSIDFHRDFLNDFEISIPSGYVKIAIEHGPVEIVVPMNSMVDLSIVMLV